MSLRQASFRQLTAFVAVAREASFGAAADELGYSQATVSQQVAALEKCLDARLFDRPGGPKPVTLTPLGRVLLPQAQHILEHLANAELDVRDVASGAAGRIKIGTFQSVAVHLLPRAVQALRATSPDITFSLFEGPSSEGLIDELLDDELDATFIEGTYEDPRLEVTMLGQDPYLLLLDPRSELRAHIRKDTFPLSELEGIDLIGQPALTYQDDVDAFLRRHGITPRYLFRTVDNGAVQAMVRSGIGPAIMPRLAVDMNDAGVITVPLGPQIEPRTISLAIKTGDKALPAARAFVEAAVEAAENVLL
jgi:DNA-binding transcriptional LysR family regulator